MGKARPAPPRSGLLVLRAAAAKDPQARGRAGIYICEKCVETAEAVIRTGQATETAFGPLQSVPGNMTQRRCGFCGKHRHQVTGLAADAGNPAAKPVGDTAICAECLILCREIHSQQLA